MKKTLEERAWEYSTSIKSVDLDGGNIIEFAQSIAMAAYLAGASDTADCFCSQNTTGGMCHEHFMKMRSPISGKSREDFEATK